MATKITDAELANHILSGVENLRHLCAVYDGGHPYIAFSMATEVHRILASNSVAVRLRGTKRFKTVCRPDDQSSLAAQLKLVIARIDNADPSVTFIPYFAYKGWDAGIQDDLKFREWWHRDTIVRGSAAKPGVPAGMIPLYPEDQVPFKKRMRLVREQFVMMMRNKLGAHLDTEIPDVLDQLQRSDLFGGDFQVQQHPPNGPVLSTLDGTLPVKVGPAAAMMRQISEEVLDAYEPP